MAGGERVGDHPGRDRGERGAGPEPDQPGDRPCPSVPAGVLVIHDAGWHPAFGLAPGPESPRVLSHQTIDLIRQHAHGLPRLRLDVDRRWDDLDTTELDGSSQAHRPRPSRPRLASGASGAAAVPGPARSAGADVVQASRRAQRRQGRAAEGRQAIGGGWLDSGADLSRSPHGEPPRAVSGDVGGLAVAVLSAAGLLWLSLMAWWG
jgi:hypothetical protein